MLINQDTYLLRNVLRNYSLRITLRPINTAPDNTIDTT